MKRSSSLRKLLVAAVAIAVLVQLALLGSQRLGASFQGGILNYFFDWNEDASQGMDGDGSNAGRDEDPSQDTVGNSGGSSSTGRDEDPSQDTVGASEEGNNQDVALHGAANRAGLFFNADTFDDYAAIFRSLARTFSGIGGFLLGR